MAGRPLRRMRMNPTTGDETVQRILRENNREDLNLSGLDLRELDFLGANLYEAILNGANLTDANLGGANLSNANLSNANLTNANLEVADLTAANLTGANLEGANLRGANLGGANLTGANLKDANLNYASLNEANLRKANLVVAHLFRANLTSANLTNANLNEANLREANLDRANLEGAELWHASLIDAHLASAHFTGADLSGADLSGANLTDANLTNAYLKGVRLRGANLKGANLSNANLYLAILNGAKLNGADLTGANLSSAYLGDANLTGANLTNANLTDAYLEGANLEDANFTDANLHNAVGYVPPVPPVRRRAFGRATGTALKLASPDTPADPKDFKKRFPKEFDLLTRRGLAGRPFRPEAVAAIQKQLSSPVEWLITKAKYTSSAQRYCSEPNDVLLLNVDLKDPSFTARQRKALRTLAEVSRRSGHPQEKGDLFTIGWVRYCAGPDSWLIEEVQSDVLVARTGLKDPTTRRKLERAGIEPEGIEEAIATLAPYTEAFFHDAVGVLFEYARAAGAEVEMLEYGFKVKDGAARRFWPLECDEMNGNRTYCHPPKAIYSELPREMGMALRKGSRTLPDVSSEVWAYRPNPFRRK